MNTKDFFLFPAVIALTSVATPTDISGFIRELIAYDISSDCFLVRWDIGDGENQYHVHYWCDSQNSLLIDEFLLEKRKEAIDALKNSANKGNMDLNKLINLPIPDGVPYGRYV